MKLTRLTPTSQILRELGQRLAQLRKHHGLTQQALATAAGVGIATLRRIEDGRDSKLGSWIRLLAVLQQDAALDQLLPESIRSPMAEAKVAPRRKSKPPPSTDDGGFAWGDQRR
jgi:transcriptional regulator with XRE-family HTH domain